jgi:glycosyltransferase involved in cell wall biosynthesis
LKLILNVSVLRGPKTGIGHYTLALARALNQIRQIDVTYFDGLATHEELVHTDSAGQSRKAEAIKRFVPGAYRLRRLLMQQRFNSACRKIKPDLYHEPSLWPLNGNTPSVMTLHDLTHIHYPETQPKNRLKEIERTCEIGLKRAGSVLVDSTFIANEVIRHYRLHPEKVVVAPLGVSDHFRERTKREVVPLLKKMGLRYGKYILSIGTLEPRKNLSFSLRAHRRLPTSLRREYPLALVGAHGWNRSHFSKDLAAGLAEGSVKRLGYVDDHSLALITNGGRMLVYPSLYEGFGLPVVEAMASGLPVVVSNRASLPEVAGNAALYVHLNDVPGFSRQMIRLIEDEKKWEKCRESGFKQVSRFTWQRCAEKTIDAYQIALHGQVLTPTR